MSDILERLREVPTIHDAGRVIEAADEIERLRTALEQLLDDMGDEGHCVCEAAKQMAQDAMLPLVSVPEEDDGKTPMARLYGCCADEVPNDQLTEDPDTFAPETREVMMRWSVECDKVLKGEA